MKTKQQLKPFWSSYVFVLCVLFTYFVSHDTFCIILSNVVLKKLKASVLKNASLIWEKKLHFFELVRSFVIVVYDFPLDNRGIKHIDAVACGNICNYVCVHCIIN